MLSRQLTGMGETAIPYLVENRCRIRQPLAPVKTPARRCSLAGAQAAKGMAGQENLVPNVKNDNDATTPARK